MVNTLNIHIIKTLSLFGIIGVVFYFAHVIFGSMFYEGYNPFSQVISDLTAVTSPSKKIASAFSFFYGLFTVIFSISFYIFFKGDINKIVTLFSIIIFTRILSLWMFIIVKKWTKMFSIISLNLVIYNITGEIYGK